MAQKLFQYSPIKGMFFTINALLICLLHNYSLLGIVDTKIDLAPSFNLPTSQRVFLISFAHGEVHERNQNYLALSAINKGIDTIISYRKQHIDRIFYHEHKNILDLEKGSGYWLWKPYFILKTLNSMSPNDILLYVDSGIFLKDSIAQIFEMLNNPTTSILLFENFHTNRIDVKRDSYDIMEVDYKHRDDMQLDAAFIAVKKTPASYEFIKKWLNYCCIEANITDSPSKNTEFEDFKTHKHDQAILTLTLIKHPDASIKVMPYHGKDWKQTPINIFFHHRRRDADQPIENFDIESGPTRSLEDIMKRKNARSS